MLYVNLVFVIAMSILSLIWWVIFIAFKSEEKSGQLADKIFLKKFNEQRKILSLFEKNERFEQSRYFWLYDDFCKIKAKSILTTEKMPTSQLDLKFFISSEITIANELQNYKEVRQKLDFYKKLLAMIGLFGFLLSAYITLIGTPTLSDFTYSGFILLYGMFLLMPTVFAENYLCNKINHYKLSLRNFTAKLLINL